MPDPQNATPSPAPTLVIKQPLWKRAGLVCMSVGFVVVGVLLVFAGNYLIGIASVVFFGACGVVILSRPSVVLTADAEGITPYYVQSRRSPKKISWSMVERIGVAKQSINVAASAFTKSELRYLAIYLHDKNLLLKKLSPTRAAVDEGLSQLGQESKLATYDDGGTAQVYIPALALPGSSVETVAEELNRLRASHTQGGNSSIAI